MSGVRKKVIAVIGAAAEPPPPAVDTAAEAIGRGVVDAGCRLVCGGMLGVMQAACRGARSSDSCGDGDVIAILPSYDRDTANPYVQIAIPTGIQLSRNTLVVSSADAVIAVGGGSGTLSEMALAWQLGKPVVALTGVGGWSDGLAGKVLDGRYDTEVMAAASAAEAVRLAVAAARRSRPEPGAIRAGGGAPGDKP